MTTQNVTERKTPVSIGDFEDTPRERETGPEVSSLQSGGLTFRDRLAGWLAASRAYWVPPRLLTDPPPSWAELVSYARHGGWTARYTGPVRSAGVMWLWLLGVPVTFACRYIEWIFQRPTRALVVFGLWRLFITTGGGPWVAGNVIHPAAVFAAWVLV